MKKALSPRSLLIALALLVATGGVALAGPSGRDINQGIWSGKSSQHLKITFNVLQSKHGLVVQPGELDFVLTCSGTGNQINAGVIFFGFNVNVSQSGSFLFHQYDELFGTISFQGTLGDTTGSGTELFAIPGLTKDLGSESCSSGNVTWSASAPPGSAPHSIAYAYQITLTRDSSGHVTESISQG